MRLALTVLFVLALAAPAQATSVEVTWPAQREYAAGEQIAVTVKAKRKVQVSVLRVTAAGKVMASVTRRTLKRGTVTATLARAGTYAVRVERRQRVLEVVPTVSAPPDCVAAPSIAVDVRLGADVVQRGQTLSYSIVNVSDGCITTGAAYDLEHQQADGTWKPVPWPLIFPLYAVILQKGATYAKAVHIPANAPLGTYRLVESGGFTEPTFQVVA